ncbi:TIGR02285 family protein [Bdellovibrio sp. 22V]|uniref:TIGR02285 family protein n=1 Tax=Bdellovibrio sp. 22V TaxID=3044166 RepID=UPI002543D0BE|nr:TIGR02285 family protein [Bdellovibrio sp. 22V]WII71631.1 TIGR02285 family protein [Bdellovibrio sp. 22V]
MALPRSFAQNSSNKNPKELVWIRWDDPPIFIFEGPFKNQGLLDVVENEITKKLPQYQHKRLDATVPRVLKEAELKSPICNAGWLDTPEWAKLFYFSKPVFLIPTNGVLIKKKNVSQLADLKRPFSLQTLLDKKPQWKLGIGRLYGEGIDDVLRKNNYQKNPKIITIATSLRVHKMLQADRIQYTLGYPFEAVYYNQLLGPQSETVVHIPLADNAPFVEVVIACPRTDWGAKVIANVNKALHDKKTLDNIAHGVDRWLSSDDKKRLAPAKKAFYQKNY